MVSVLKTALHFRKDPTQPGEDPSVVKDYI